MCKRPFKDNPEGCPNFGKHEDCPPNTKLLNEVFDLDKEVFVIYTEFPLGTFADKMMSEHPDWDIEKVYDRFFWEPVAKKQQEEDIESFKQAHPHMIVKTCPEAHGVNVVNIMEKLDIALKWDWPPKHKLENKTYLVALAGFAKAE